MLLCNDLSDTIQSRNGLDQIAGDHGMMNPDFFFLPGAGPVLDVGPYYVTNLVQLIGPVTRVGAVTTTPSLTRTRI